MIPLFTNKSWSAESIALLKEQYEQIADFWMNEMREGTYAFFKHFEDFLQNRNNTQRGTVPCGSGRAYGVINPQGDYFPCSRWGIHAKEEWSFGNIYEEFREDAREKLLKGFDPEKFPPECKSCIAQCICSGGCLAENLDTVGDPFGVIPEACEIMRVWVKVGKRIHDTMFEEKNEVFMQRYYSNHCLCLPAQGCEAEPLLTDSQG